MSQKEVIITETDLGLFTSEKSLSILTRQTKIETINDIFLRMPKVFKELKLKNENSCVCPRTLLEAIILATEHDNRYAIVVFIPKGLGHVTAAFRRDCTFDYVVPILVSKDTFSLLHFTEDSGVTYDTPNPYMVFKSFYVDFCGFKVDDSGHLMEEITDELMAKLGMVREGSF